MTIKNYQMLWDCGHCGTKKLLGVSDRHCPNCGAAQDENKRYFPSAGEEIELINHIYYGVDWDCNHCSTPNSNNSNNCRNCGGPKKGTYEVKLVGQNPNVKRKKHEDVEIKANIPDKNIESKTPKEEKLSNGYSFSESVAQEKIKTKKEKTSSGNRFNFFIVLIACVFIALVSFLIYGFSKVDDYNVTVTEKSWSRSINIEEYQSENDTAWCSSMPSDAYGVSRYRDIRSHRQVPDGSVCHTEKRDRGDGSYSSQRVCHEKFRSEPVYDYRCTYKVDRWKFSNSVLAKGNQLEKAYFPDVSHYEQRKGNFLGNTRVGSRHESYKVVFSYQDEKTVYSNCFYNQSKWENFNVHGEYKGRVRMIGGLICSEIMNSTISGNY